MKRSRTPLTVLLILALLLLMLPAVFSCKEREKDNGHAHVFGEWTELRAPTYISDGEQTRVCTACGDIERAVIPKLQPDLNGDNSVNILDVTVLLNFLAVNNSNDMIYDLNNDGLVNILDVAELLNDLATAR